MTDYENSTDRFLIFAIQDKGECSGKSDFMFPPRLLPSELAELSEVEKKELAKAQERRNGAAATLCGRCTVRDECLEFGLREWEKDKYAVMGAVYGGYLFNSQKAINLVDPDESPLKRAEVLRIRQDPQI